MLRKRGTFFWTQIYVVEDNQEKVDPKKQWLIHLFPEATTVTNNHNPTASDIYNHPLTTTIPQSQTAIATHQQPQPPNHRSYNHKQPQLHNVRHL